MDYICHFPPKEKKEERDESEIVTELIIHLLVYYFCQEIEEGEYSWSKSIYLKYYYIWSSFKEK